MEKSCPGKGKQHCISEYNSQFLLFDTIKTKVCYYGRDRSMLRTVFCLKNNLRNDRNKLAVWFIAPTIIDMFMKM